jgi:hypothetical protein
MDAKKSRSPCESAEAVTENFALPMRPVFVRTDMATLPFHETASIRPNLTLGAEGQLATALRRGIAGKIPYWYNDVHDIGVLPGGSNDLAYPAGSPLRDRE